VSELFSELEDCCSTYSVETQPTFRRQISPPSSGSNKPSKIPARKQVASTLHTDPIWKTAAHVLN
jgi:hypothetical protein